MIRHKYQDLIIELVDEEVYSPGSGNCRAYAKQYFADSLESSNRSYQGINIYKDELLVDSCLIIGYVGTTIHQYSSLIDNNSLLICCGDTLFSLNIPSLSINWQIDVDPVACFGVYMLQESYLIHGELEIVRMDRNGNVMWTFSGADIFVRPEGGGELTLEDEQIKLVDWQDNVYIIDFNGKLIWDSFKRSSS